MLSRKIAAHCYMSSKTAQLFFKHSDKIGTGDTEHNSHITHQVWHNQSFICFLDEIQNIFPRQRFYFIHVLGEDLPDNAEHSFTIRKMTSTE